MLEGNESMAPPASQIEAAESIRSRIHQLVRTAVRPDARRQFLHDLSRSWMGEPPLPPRVRAVAVVCHGNICRSPFAAALLQQAHPELSVRSVGLEAADGDPADAQAIALAAEWRVDLTAHRTRRLCDDDIESVDLVLTMDAMQSELLTRRWPGAGARQRLLGDFLPGRPFAIVDPWGKPEELWRRTYARIALAVERVSKRLVAPIREGEETNPPGQLSPRRPGTR